LPMTLPLLFGANVDPLWSPSDAPLRHARNAERLGLDLITIQDHPYQAAFYDAWTLLTYLAARTERITLVPTVASLPLRPPAVLAKSAASLDLLTGGRVQLGLGATEDDKYVLRSQVLRHETKSFLWGDERSEFLVSRPQIPLRILELLVRAAAGGACRAFGLVHDDVAPGMGLCDIAPRRQPDHVQPGDIGCARCARDGGEVRRLRNGGSGERDGAERQHKQAKVHALRPSDMP